MWCHAPLRAIKFAAYSAPFSSPFVPMGMKPCSTVLSSTSLGSLQMSGRDKPVSAQAGDTLLSRGSPRFLALESLSGIASVAPCASSQPPLSEQGHPDMTPARHSGRSMQSVPSCMDAGLQWDAAILTVMVEGEAASTGQGKPPITPTLLEIEIPARKPSTVH
jgi:hypothetical protein